jgi:hypothetical protein
MQTHSFAKKIVYFIIMRRDCIKVATILSVRSTTALEEEFWKKAKNYKIRNSDRVAEETLYPEQPVYMHVQDMQVDDGLTTAYNSLSSLKGVRESAIEYLQDFVTYSLLDLSRPRLVIFID